MLMSLLDRIVWFMNGFGTKPFNQERVFCVGRCCIDKYWWISEDNVLVPPHAEHGRN